MSTDLNDVDETTLRRDVQELVGELPPTAPMSAGHQVARRRHLEATITDRPAGGRRGRRVTVALAAAGVAVFVAAGSAAAYIAWAPATDPTYARCYSSASLAAGTFGTVTEAVAAGEPDSADAPDHALEMCALWWNFELTGETSYDGAADGDNEPPVPDLVACVLKNGAVGVFPGDSSTCESLGLPQLATG